MTMDVHGYTAAGGIDVTIEGVRMSVPDAPGNRHRQMIAEWEAEGNTIPDFVPAPPSLENYEDAIQAHIDARARKRTFRDGVTLASYAASTNPQWAADAEAFIAWRDSIWAYAYAELAEVQGGLRPQPSVEAFILELPAISWPD